MYELTGIRIYPIKSCAGLSVTEATLGKDGLELDRRLMIVNADGRFLTQRTHPQMARMRIRLTSDGLTIAFENEECLVHLSSWHQGPLTVVRIWGHDSPAHAYDEHINAFLSDCMHERVRLVSQPTPHGRIPKRRPHDLATGLSFADAYPLLIAGEASLEALNRAQPAGCEPFPMDRFRPNLIVRTRTPWEEDIWNRFRIANATIHGVKRCVRCPIIRINQVSGMADHPNEPTDTLKRIHHANGQPIFGLYAIHEGLAQIRVGDRIEAIEFGDPPEP